MLSQKKKNLRPGEDYSIYKLKAAASVCKASVKKKKKVLIWQIPI